MLEFATALLIGLAIFVLSAQPNLHVSSQPMLDFVVHKSGHMVAYGLLALAVELMLEDAGMARRQAVLVALLLVVGYGATDELHQAFVPGRTPSPIDVTVDLAGGIAALVLSRRWPARLDDLRPS
jgi:VanZ family protein